MTVIMKPTRILFSFTTLALLASLAGCRTSSKADTAPLPANARQVEAFTRLETEGNIDVTYIQTAGTPHIAYSAAPATARYIEVDSRPGTLRLATSAHRPGGDGLRYAVTVYAPAPEAVVCRGTGSIGLGDLASDRPLLLSLAGSGDIEAGSVKAQQVTVELSGSGDIRLRNVDTDGQANVTLSGSGDLRAEGVAASDTRYVLNGSGDFNIGRTDCQTNESTLNGSGVLFIKNVSSATTSLRLNGSGDVIADAVKGDDVDASVHGTGDLTLTSVSSERITAFLQGTGLLSLGGKTKTAALTIDGDGTIDATGLRAGEIKSDKKDDRGDILLP